MKPIDTAIFRMVSKSPGRNVSEPRGGLENMQYWRSSPLSPGEGSMVELCAPLNLNCNTVKSSRPGRVAPRIALLLPDAPCIHNPN
jgi:hypothetical protein